MEETLSIIKPDGVGKKIIGTIFKRFEDAGLEIVNIKRLTLTTEKAGEFFGIFNTFGKAGAFMGPALVGIFLAIFKNTIVMLLPILILFVLGLIVLYFVDTNEVV